MKTKNKEIHIGKLILKVVLGFAIGISIGYGITKFFKSSNRLTASIEKTIQQNYDCESVEKNVSTAGIQFSKEDGLTNLRTSFSLKNCKYKGSAIEEAKRINEYLKRSVENYESIAVLELTFKTN